MPMYWNEFWQAVEGQPDFVIVGYQRALAYYWHHNHCVGLRDNDEALRKVCRIDREQWEECSSIIFGEFFNRDEETGLWHQKRARAEYVKAEINYNAQVLRGKKGAVARWSSVPKRKRA